MDYTFFPIKYNLHLPIIYSLPTEALLNENTPEEISAQAV